MSSSRSSWQYESEQLPAIPQPLAAQHGAEEHVPPHSRVISFSAEPFSRLITSHWLDLASRLQRQSTAVLNGQNLTIAAVVLAARYGGSVSLDKTVLPGVQRSSEVLRDLVNRGESMYGVNTGFGGSADSRTTDLVGLQEALLRQLQYGVLSNEDLRGFSENILKKGDVSSKIQQKALPIGHSRQSHDMPLAWVRGAMAVRVNSLCQGASGIAPETIQVLIKLLTADIVPQVPLRGSISASGDLSPLAYIAGVMQGNPALKAYKDEQLLPSNEALSKAGIEPANYGPKEALAIVNGTAVSAAVGSIAMHEVLQLAAVSQILTAMSVEAVGGTLESFDPFIARIRPHPGQINSAKCIRGFLKNTQLTSNEFSANGVLRQDRYPLRTSTQWIGPALEDLQLAYTQVSTEINSVTDNPLIDADRQQALSGGNFQARAVTAAMEKSRQACQTIGKMLFAQCTEMINPSMNRGLPPNLVSDEPSQSFMFKGTDLMIAALSSELGFLSTPVNYVEHAEMGNQAINSMALVSARYTLEAADVLSQLAAAHLGAACQALDLRVMQRGFLQKLHPEFTSAFAELCNNNIEHLWVEFQQILDKTTIYDSKDRIPSAANAMQRHLIDAITANPALSSVSIAQLKAVTDTFGETAFRVYHENRAQYMATPDATAYLGNASKAVYVFIRQRLGVPFVGEGVLRDAKMAFGTAVQSPIYAAIRSGAFWPVIAGCFEEAEKAEAPQARL